MKKNKSFTSLLIVYLAVFIDILGFGIIIPVLPYYASELGANGFWIGSLMTVYSVAQFISAPVLGRISDRVGRRPILVISLAGSAFSFFLAGFSKTLGLLFFARLLAGLFGGSISPAQAFIADITPKEERSKYMGMLGASIGLGFVFGPALGAGLSHLGFGAAAWVASGLAFINFILAYFKLPESRVLPTSASTTTAFTRTAFSILTLLKAFRRPKIGVILGANFLLVLSFVFMEAVFALLGKDYYAVSSRELGFIFTYIGVLIVIVQGVIVGRLSKRFGDASLCFIGSLILAITLVLMPYSPSLLYLLIDIGFMSLGQGLVSPTLSSMLSKSAGVDEQGGVLGLGQSMGAIARALAPVSAGALYDQSIYAPFISAGLIAFLSFLLLLTLRKNN